MCLRVKMITIWTQLARYIHVTPYCCLFYLVEDRWKQVFIISEDLDAGSAAQRS